MRSLSPPPSLDTGTLKALGNAAEPVVTGPAGLVVTDPAPLLVVGASTILLPKDSCTLPAQAGHASASRLVQRHP